MTNEIDMRVGMDVAQAKAELESLKRSVSGFVNEVRTTANGLRINVNAQFDDAAARAAIESFRNGLRGETVRITVDVAGVVGAQGALDGVRNAVLGLGAATATTLPILRDYNDELNRMQLAARAAADEVRRAAAEQERLRRAGGGNGGGGNGGGSGGADNDGSVWRKHALSVTNVAQEYSGLSATLLATKSAMAILTASVAGAIPVLAQMAATGGAAMATFASTQQVAAMSKELDYLTQKTTISAQALQEWRVAGRFGGLEAEFSSVGDVGGIFESITEKIAGLKTGSDDGKEFAKSLKDIGINAKTLQDAGAEEVLLKIGEALSKTKMTSQEKSKYLNDLSNDAAKLLPLLEKNSTQFAEVRKYANAVGAIRSQTQLDAMKQTNVELSYMKLGLEGVVVRLSDVGSNVVNTLAPNIRQLFIDARQPIQQWSNDVDKALKKFKTDLDNTGSWTIAIKLSLKEAYPTLYGFVASAADFGRGYGQAFITPMLNELKRGYASIRGALGEAGGAENVGKGLGEAMLPVVGIVRNVVDAVKLLIVNWDQLKTIASYTPVGFVVANWDKVTAAFAAVGSGIKTVAGYFGLLNPATLGNVSGMQMFTATLLGLVAAGASTRLALGALGAAFSVIRFAIAPVILAVQVAPAVFGALATAVGVAGRALQVLALAARLNPIVAGITAVAAVATVLITNWDKVAPFFSSLWTGVKGSFDRAFKGISDVPWYQVPIKIVQGFGSLAKVLFKVGVDAIAELAVGILKSMGMPEKNARQTVISIIGALSGMPSKLWDIGVAAMGKLADAVMDAGKQVVANMQEMVSNAMQAGRDAVAGLAKGITDGSEKLGKAVRDLVGVVDSGVTDELEIQSPSRVMMRYGGFVAEGLAIGITAKGLQAVDSARVLSAKIASAIKIPQPDFKLSLPTFTKVAPASVIASPNLTKEVLATNSAYQQLTLSVDSYGLAQDKISASSGAWGEQLTQAQKLSKDLGQTLQQEVLGGLQKLVNTGNDLLDKLINKMLESVLMSDEMTKGFGSIFGGSSGAGGSGGGLGSLLSGLFGFAQGGTFTPQAVHAYASGDTFHNTILKQTTPFMTAQGLAVAGEAGAEAVMPLMNGSHVRARMPDGSVQGLEVTRINGMLGVAIRETARNVGRYATGGTFNTSNSSHSNLNNSSISSDANVSLNFDVNINVSGGSESKETSVEVRKQLSDFEQRIYKNIPTIVRSAQVAARRSPNL